MLHHGRIDGQHEAVVADRLEVVRGPVALRVAFEVEHRLATVGSHRQVAAEAAGDPGRVAALPRHPRVGVRELTGLAVLGNGGAPDGTVAAERPGEAGFRTAGGGGPGPPPGRAARAAPPPPRAPATPPR